VKRIGEDVDAPDGKQERYAQCREDCDHPDAAAGQRLHRRRPRPGRARHDAAPTHQLVPAVGCEQEQIAGRGGGEPHEANRLAGHRAGHNQDDEERDAGQRRPSRDNRNQVDGDREQRCLGGQNHLDRDCGL
jgi:hypothetical protein